METLVKVEPGKHMKLQVNIRPIRRSDKNSHQKVNKTLIGTKKDDYPTQVRSPAGY